MSQTLDVPEGYKLTEVGVIPGNWEVSCVGDSFEVANHLRLPISEALREKMNGDYPYYGPTSVQGWINEYRVDGQYALIGEDGDHFLKWRSQSMTLLVSGKFNVNNHAHLIHGIKNLTAWFYWFFANRDITAHLTRQGASRYKLNKSTLLKVACALPPCEEQRAIANALSDVDALLAKQGQLIAKKQGLKQAAMQQLLTGQTRLPGFSEEWEVKRLGDVLKVRHGRSQHEIEVSGGIYPILASGGEIGRTDTCLYDKPSVLIGRKGTIDKPKYQDQPFWTVDTLFYTEVSSTAHPKFIYYQFLMIDWRSYNEASGVPSLNASTIEAVEIGVPKLKEQTAIATVLSDMDAELAALQVRQDKTRALKQGMMQALLTGRIRLV